MVAGTPRVLPPGYMSLWQAMDCIDPGVLQEGSSQARQDADRFLTAANWAAVANGEALIAPGPVYEELDRRARRREAFRRVCELCAYGAVPSALLLGNFTRRQGIPPDNWLGDRLADEMRSTGRTTVGDRPRCVSGWVMIDAAAFRAAVARDRAKPPNGEPIARVAEPHGASPAHSKSATDVPAGATHPCPVMRGPRKGSVDRWSEADRALYPFIDELIRDGRMSLTAATIQLANEGKIARAPGTTAQLESLAKRVARRYTKESKFDPTSSY